MSFDGLGEGSDIDPLYGSPVDMKQKEQEYFTM